MTSRPSVVILGGGAAGLAAAVGHMERGHRVTLVEARRHLGGRAWSFRDRITGCEVDNGPHVLLGCYRAFRHLLRALGTEHAFYRQPRLELSWLYPGGRLLQLTPPRLPAPLHLIGGLLSLEGLEVAERWELLLSGLAPFLRLPPPRMTLGEWFSAAGHDGAARQLLFEPLCRAVMNDEPGRTEAALFFRTLREAFRGGCARSAMWIPTEPWRRILDEPAQEILGRQGARLLLGKRVSRLELREPAPAVHLADGTVLHGHSRVVCALPWAQAAALDPDRRFVARARQMDAAPLVSVHVTLPAGSVPFAAPIAAFVSGSPFHFLCRRPDPGGRALSAIPACVMAGGAFALDAKPARMIVELALDQLGRYLGRREPWPEATTESALVVREARATVTVRPQAELLRPPAGPTAVPGLWLAGDWTDTGLPSTLEGAARSALDPLVARR